MKITNLSAITLALSMTSTAVVADVVEGFEDGNFSGWNTTGTVEINITKAAVKIGGETCLHFQYEMWGLVAAQYTPATVSGAILSHPTLGTP